MPTPVIYEIFKLKQHNGAAIDLDTNAIKVMLLDSVHSVNQAHDFIDDIDTNEVSGTNYTAGGKTIGTNSIALDSGVVEWTHDDIVWAQHASGFANARFAVWYYDTGNSATAPIIMSMDFGSDKGNVAGDLTLDVDQATGVLNI